ncbi:MAG: molybdopterin oxidoreductase family protein [Anaerolineae bacterium]|nr:molybdopterin oxidoreductase family protein [Anaerolineae bacterium]
MTKNSSLRTHYRTCNLCEAMCGIEIKVRGDEVLSIRGDENDPFSQGHICPKATALQDIYNDPDRLKHPVRRTENGWEEISWQTAFNEVETNLKAIQAKYGNHAVGIYLGNPNVHNLGSILFGSSFIRSLRTKNRFSATSVDQLPHHFAAYFMFGHQLLLPIPDIDRTHFMLMFGANPLQSNGSLMTAPGVEKRLKAIQARGGKVVVIDPRQTRTAKLADQHLFIKPSMDALLMLAMVYTLFDENLVNMGKLESFTDGVAQVQSAVADFAPEDLAETIGIEAEMIRQVTRDFAQAESAVCYGRMGVSTQEFGGLCHWLINTINILTGNLDSLGGAMFTLPAVDIVDITTKTRQVGSYGRWQSRVSGRPEFSGELPVSILGEELLTEGDGQLRAMVTVAGNPILSTPNGQQLDEGFANLEFMVAVDIYINETTRHANIILPPTTGLETEHYDISFHALAVRNTTKFSEILFEPESDTMTDWEILRELRLRMEKGTKREGSRDYFTRFSPSRLIDLAIRYGPYGNRGMKPVSGEGIKLKDLRDNPHGIDLGALVPVLPQRLVTQGKRIQLAPEIILNDISRVHQHLQDSQMAQANGYDLQLIGRRHIRSNNSWMHNSERLVRGKNRCTVMMHPDDAESHGFADGQAVCVRSQVGQVEIPVEITDTIMRGVVSIPHGWGHNRTGVKLSVAQEYAGVSLNDLTDDKRLDVLTGNAAFSGVPVAIEAL